MDPKVTIELSEYEKLKDTEKRLNESCDLEIKSMERRLKKQSSAICIISVYEPVESNRHGFWTHELFERSVNIVNTESEFFESAKEHIGDIDLLKKRISDFEKTKAGKFLNFFGIVI